MLRIRIRIILRSRIRIRIGIKVKSRIRIGIKVKSRIQIRIKVKSRIRFRIKVKSRIRLKLNFYIKNTILTGNRNIIWHQLPLSYLRILIVTLKCLSRLYLVPSTGTLPIIPYQPIYRILENIFLTPPKNFKFVTNLDTLKCYSRSVLGPIYRYLTNHSLPTCLLYTRKQFPTTS